MKINKHELFKTLGWLGGAVLLAGFIRYQMEATLRWPSKTMLIGGGALLAASLAMNFRAVRAFFSRRGTKLGANTLVLVSSVAAILAILNLLGYRYHKRFDLTTEKLYTLSDQTRQIVSSLQKDVRILEFAKEANAQLAGLIPEYRSLSRRVAYERIDPEEHPDLAKQHAIARLGEVVLTTGNRTERLEEFTEQAITNTILKVSRDAVKTVCFVEGHGEKSLNSMEGDGYALVARGLRGENYQVKTINLVTEKTVPGDCTVVVVAGPTAGLFPQEVSLLTSFLDAGGKVLFLLDPFTTPNLDSLLAAWNIQLGNDILIEQNLFSQLTGTGPVVPLIGDYGSHRITERMRAQTLFRQARSVRAASTPKPEVDTVELLKTSEQSWAETELPKGGGRVALDPAKDTKGPVSIGVVASKKVQEKQARLVVIGDSDFATNADIRQVANADLFFNTINWLAEDEDLISVRPKSPTNRRVTLTQAQQTLLFWFALVLLPGAVILTGGYIWWKHR